MTASPADSASQVRQPPPPTGRVLVTLCTYNERENLGPLIAQIIEAAPDVNILVIDDNSPDGTGILADDIAAERPQVHVLHRPLKQGLGRATLAGLEAALDRHYDFWLNMDADFSHAPQDLPVLLQAMQRADVAIGSRYVPGGGTVGWGVKRHLMSRTINLYARLLLGLRTKDNSGAFRCYRLSRMGMLDLSRFRATGYAVQEELLYRCRRLGCTFTEVPITFHDRRHGQSKINLKEAYLAVWVMLQLAWDRVRGVSVT
ncbi:MAG: polyprenol monophosphomannose synthase [Planctomycetaceae bacterium]